jgi:hypothetical protein
VEVAAVFFNWLATMHRAILDFPWTALIAAVAGTFVGAYAAFRLEHNARAAEEMKRRAIEGNLALLTLTQMYDALGLYRGTIIDDLPQNEVKPWLSLRVTYSLTFKPLGFDATKLHFLFESKDANLLPELLIEGHRFDLTTEMIATHKRLMLEEAHPKLAAAGVTHGSPVSEEDWEMLLGPKTTSEVREVTTGIVNAVPKAMNGITKMFVRLRRQLRELLPGERFIQVEFYGPSKGPKTEASGKSRWRVSEPASGATKADGGKEGPQGN